LGEFTGQKAARCEDACPNHIPYDKQSGVKKIELSFELHDQALSHQFLKKLKKEGAEPFHKVLKRTRPLLNGDV
jgi:hypothetical protein